MSVNAPARRRRHRRRRRNPIANLNPRRRRSYRRRRRNPIGNMPMHRRRSYGRRRSRRNSPVRVPRTLMGFFSAQFLTEVGFAALGAVTPSFVTDRLLPMMGMGAFITGPWVRRFVQFLVPTGVVMFMPAAFGRQAGAFALGAYAVTAVGFLNDMAPGFATLGAYEVAAPVSGLGRYEFAAPGLGLDQDEAELLYAG